MAFETVKINVDARGVARVALARADVLNAFNEAMIAELTSAYAELGDDKTVRVIVLEAEGRAFCAGADLTWMQRAAANSEAENLADAERFAEMMRTLYECPKPTLARVQGPAYGGGVGLMCACDIVVASSDAKFGVTEAKFGILPAVIGPYLINAVGPRQAKRLALTTEIFSAERAGTMGLAHEIVAPGDMDRAIEAIVANLLRSGPGALAEIKILFRSLGVGPITADVRSLTAQTIAGVRGRDEAREGFAAFFDKRPPGWAA